MRALIRRILQHRFVPLLWTLLTIVLLCMPGSLLPGTGLFDVPYLDKFVHIILFGGVVFAWGVHFTNPVNNGERMYRIYLLITLLTICLGIILEFVQLYFIPFRSFDGGDIFANSIGSAIAAIMLMVGGLRKHKQPVT
jgi:hypothetical protein